MFRKSVNSEGNGIMLKERKNGGNYCLERWNNFGGYWF